LFARDITKYKQSEIRMQQHLRRLAALRRIDLAIVSGLDLNLLISLLLEQITTLLHVDAASLLLMNPEVNLLTLVSTRGFSAKTERPSRLRLGEGYAGKVALENKMIGIPNLEVIPSEEIAPDYIRGEGFMAYYGLPLTAKGNVLGVLEVLHGTPLKPDADWLEFLNILSGQAAIAVDNALLFKNLQKSNVELSMAYDSTIEGWSRTLDLRDKETEGHTRRVAEMALRLALALGVDKQDLVHLQRGAVLHDIGKVAIPDEILFKPGPLSETEWAIMRRHPAIAVDLLAPISYLTPALEIPHWHHERWDGSGYPDHLKGEQIPLSARIFAVVDVYDALTSDRPYRNAWSKEDAVRYIESQSGKYFDPFVVPEFLKLVKLGAQVVRN
jgi:HD-GYP domain-containing protein (c-di-GMP phosphodiesterase class II)